MERLNLRPASPTPLSSQDTTAQTDDNKSVIGAASGPPSTERAGTESDTLADFLFDSNRELDLHYTVQAEALEPSRFLDVNKLACERGSPGIQTVRLSLTADSITSTTPQALDALCEGLSQLPLDVLTLRLPSQGLAGKRVVIDLGKLQRPKEDTAHAPPRIEIVMPDSEMPHTCKLEVMAPAGAKAIGLANNFFVHKPLVHRVDGSRKPTGNAEVLHRVPYLGKGSDWNIRLNEQADFNPPGGLLQSDVPPKISCRHIAPHFNDEYARYQLAKDSKDNKDMKAAFPPDSLRTTAGLSQAIDSTRAEDDYRNHHRMGAERVTEMRLMGTTFNKLFQSMRIDGKRFRQVTLPTFNHVLAANLKVKDGPDGKHQEHVLVLGDPNFTASRLRMKVQSPADLEGLALQNFIGAPLQDQYSRSLSDPHLSVYPSETPQSAVRAELDLDQGRIHAQGISKLLQSGQYAHHSGLINEAMAKLEMEEDDQEALKQGFAAGMQRDVPGMELYINHVLDTKAYSTVDRCNLLGKEIDQNGRCLTPLGWALDSASSTTVSGFVKAVASAPLTSIPQAERFRLLAGKGLHHETEPMLHGACDLTLTRDKYAPGFLPALHQCIYAYVAGIMDSTHLSASEKNDLCNPVHDNLSVTQAAHEQGNLGAYAAILCAVLEHPDSNVVAPIVAGMVDESDPDFMGHLIDALNKPSVDARGLPSPDLDKSNAQWATRIVIAFEQHMSQTSESMEDSKTQMPVPTAGTDKGA